jgi:hypothetical protein
VKLRLLFFACLVPIFASAQFSPPGENMARSVSGQFIVIGSKGISPLANSPRIATNADFVRLEPALLAVSAERVKDSLWSTLGVNASTRWRGRIFLALHPARSLDEDVTIVSKPSDGGWNYQVQLPDVLSRARFARAMAGVLLLEFADRKATTRPAEIPDWLIDGLSQQLLAANLSEIILSSPDQTVNGLPVTRIDTTERGINSSSEVRRVLKNSPILTFEQLSWPTVAQLSGDDDGVYRASAQVFVARLLNLKNGPAKLRAMLQTLSRYYNWQTAFESAFQENFHQPRDVEKWWALQVVSFVARDPGPQWTPAVSRDRLDEILSVPVEVRAASNALPSHAEVSLQAVIRNFDSSWQFRILQTKLRDLELAQLRMAPQLIALADAYRRTIADYLSENGRHVSVSPFNKHSGATQMAAARQTLKKLDALDAKRRTIEATIKPDIVMP